MLVFEDFAHLLGCPFRGRMVRDIAVKNPPRTDLHRDENVENAKRAVMVTRKSQATIASAWLRTKVAQR